MTEAFSSEIRKLSHRRRPCFTHQRDWLGGKELSILSKSPRLYANSQEDAEALLERVRQMREEIAALEGKSVQDVESEAKLKKDKERKLQEKEMTSKTKERPVSNDGRFLQVPETAEEQVIQAKGAIERAFQQNITRQTVRFALLGENEFIYSNQDQLWPGGPPQMYREAAKPMTEQLLEMLLVPTQSEGECFSRRNNVTSQDVWDFDGSGVVTAESPLGASADVQALVQPNTDTKYLKDIQTMDAVMKDRLLLLVNPFWRDLDSWGFNLLAMNAQKMARATVFDRGYNETYCCIQKTVRGEDCVLLKAYPYDWQIYAYAEQDDWPYQPIAVRLGSSAEEPTVKKIAELLDQREEFKLSKNMRNLQRMTGGR